MPKLSIWYSVKPVIMHNNLTSVDQSTDTPTNNFATMNPLRQPTGNPATLTTLLNQYKLLYLSFAYYF